MYISRIWKEDYGYKCFDHQQVVESPFYTSKARQRYANGTISFRSILFCLDERTI